MFRTIRTVSTGILLAAAGCGLAGDADDGVTKAVTTCSPRVTNSAPRRRSTSRVLSISQIRSSSSWARTRGRARRVTGRPGLDDDVRRRTIGCSTTPTAWRRCSTRWTRVPGPTPTSPRRTSGEAAFEPTMIEHGLTRFTRTVPATAEFAVARRRRSVGVLDAQRDPQLPAAVAHDERGKGLQHPLDERSGAGRAGHLRERAPRRRHAARAARPGQPGSAAQGRRRPRPVPGPVLRPDQRLITRAGSTPRGAKGGPANLSTLPVHARDERPGARRGFNRKVFDIYDAWAARATARGRGSPAGRTSSTTNEFDITGVPGFNDVLGQPTIRGTCSTCHNTPNVGRPLGDPDGRSRHRQRAELQCGRSRF